MSLRQRLLFLFCIQLSLPCLSQTQPELVVPAGYFMESAGLNHEGDLVTIASDKLNVWDLDSLRLRYSVKFNTKGSYNAHYSADGKYIIVSYSGYKTTVVDAATGKSLHFLDGWIQDILKKEISPDGKKIITTKETAMVWDLETGKLLLELGRNEIGISYSSFDNSGTRILTGHDDGTIKIWDATDGRLLQTMSGNRSMIFYACFSADDKYLASADYNKGSMVFETATGRVVSTIQGHTARVNDVQFSHDKKFLLSASGNKAYVWSVDDGKKITELTGHNGEVITCRFTEDENFVITSSTDKTLRKWTLPSGKQITKVDFNGEYGNYSIYNNRLILCNKDRINLYTYPDIKPDYSLLPLDSGNHLVLDALGRYDGTESARKFLYFKCGEEVINLDQVKEQLWIPSLAERINKGEAIHGKTISELNICDLVPLTASIARKDEKLQFNITPRRGGLGEVILYINGIEANRYLPSQLQRVGSTYELIINKSGMTEFLMYGKQNVITVKAYTKDKQFSSRGAGTTSAASAERNIVPPNLYAVMVGVSDYKGDGMDLRYAAKDAIDFSNAISATAKKMLNTDGKEHVFIYQFTTAVKRHGWPEKNGIKKIFEEIADKATANDILLIFFAGHGIMAETEKQFYFLTAEASSLSATTGFKDAGISTTELTNWIQPKKIRAQKRILIFDACNSGQAIKDMVNIGSAGQGFITARNDLKARQVKAIDKLNEQSGLFILSASASDQSAYEMSKYAQGLLTYSLLKAIKLQPDILMDGKWLDLGRWFSAAERTVSDETRFQEARQRPQMISNTNFTIGMVDDEVKSKIILPEEKPIFTNSNLQNKDEEIAIDDLGLNRMIDQRLAVLSEMEKGLSLHFAPNYSDPGAYAIGGRYEAKENIIIARLNIRKGNLVKHRFEVSGRRDKLDELVNSICIKISELVK